MSDHCLALPIHDNNWRSFKRPPKGTIASTSKLEHDLITEIQPLTEANDDVPSTSSTKATPHQAHRDSTSKSFIFNTPTHHDVSTITVEVGKFYEPSLLPDYKADSFQLKHDKLIQYDVRDIHGNLIPAWKLEHELRPGTVVCVTAVLHIYNMKNDRGSGFRCVCLLHHFWSISNHSFKQFFQIDA